MKAHTVCARAQASIFTVLCSFSQRNCQIVGKSERWKNKWSKVKTLPDKPRSRWPVFFANCVKNVIEKAVSICVIIQQDCKVKTWLVWLSINILKKKKKVKWRKNRNELLKHSVHGTNVRHAHPKLLGHLRVSETLTLKTKLSTNPLKWKWVLFALE